MYVGGIGGRDKWGGEAERERQGEGGPFNAPVHLLSCFWATATL